jgi:hypothetical protein
MKIKIKEKKFDKKLLEVYSEIKEKSNKDFPDIHLVDNVYLIFQKLFENKDKKGTYVECGVYTGGTLMSAVNFAKETDIDFNFVGVDTFEGFPDNFQHHKNDLPYAFNKLYDEGLISEEHFEKAKNRTDDFKNISHLQPVYFQNNFNFLFDFCDKHDVTLLKGSFQYILSNFKHFGGDKKIDILHLDCDLYESYLNCLNKLYKNVSKGGSIIFDEYYSHKYPGARMAVNEFFEDKKGYFEKYVTSEGFERWCFVKE